MLLLLNPFWLLWLLAMVGQGVAAIALAPQTGSLGPQGRCTIGRGLLPASEHTTAAADAVAAAWRAGPAGIHPAVRSCRAAAAGRTAQQSAPVYASMCAVALCSSPANLLLALLLLMLLLLVLLLKSQLSHDRCLPRLVPLQEAMWYCWRGSWDCCH